MNGGAHLAGRGHRVKGWRCKARDHNILSADMLINLLNLLADFARSEFHSRSKTR